MVDMRQKLIFVLVSTLLNETTDIKRSYLVKSLLNVYIGYFKPN